MSYLYHDSVLSAKEILPNLLEPRQQTCTSTLKKVHFCMHKGFGGDTRKTKHKLITIRDNASKTVQKTLVFKTNHRHIGL